MTDLLDPLVLQGLTLRNRLWVPAMCMYAVQAGDGVPTDFHLAHYAARAAGGYGLTITEATAVNPAGRISLLDTGLWSDAHVEPWARIVALCHSLGGAIGVQLAHAGRKASVQPGLPGRPGGALTADDGAWPTVSASAVAFPGFLVPHELTIDEIGGVIADFVDAARRAAQAGFDVVELHAAHGYLLHQFLSPLSNQRSDGYGGSFAGRVRLLLEVTDAVRAVWPRGRPMFVRLSATDWLDGGWDVEQSVEVARLLAARGVDLIDVSSGGLLPASITLEPGYQVPFARRIRAEAGVATAAVGLITDADQAAAILRDGSADAVLLGRESLRSPYLPVQLAGASGRGGEWAPASYWRAWP